MIGNPEQERHTMPSGALGLVAVSDTSWFHGVVKPAPLYHPSFASAYASS